VSRIEKFKLYDERSRCVEVNFAAPNSRLNCRYAGISVILGYSRHSREGGNPGLEANNLDSRLRGNYEAYSNGQVNHAEGKPVADDYFGLKTIGL